MMQWQAPGSHTIPAFFYRNRTGGIGFAALYGFGFIFGHALFTAVYRDGVPKMFLQVAILPASLPLGSTLLCTVLPALLFLCCMLYCAYERLALPLWGLCMMLSGIRDGLCMGLMACMGVAWRMAWNIPLLLGRGLLALLCLDIRRTQENLDGLNALERFLVPCTAYLIAASAIQSILLLCTASLTQGRAG